MNPLSRRIAWFISVAWLSVSQAALNVDTYETICSVTSNVINDVIVSCSCPSTEDTLIIHDVAIKVGEGGWLNTILPANTTYLSVGGCSTVHVSGHTLTTLTNLHILNLHDIIQLHVAYDFFLQLATPLQSLLLSNTTLAKLEDFPIIHAQNLHTITLDKMVMHGVFKLLIVTEDDQAMALISITNSKIDKLGEINISPRSVKKFVLQNNTIGTIMTSAIIQDTSNTLIQDNNITSFAFLAFESSTSNFTLVGNTVSALALESLVINNATMLTITNNSFFHIEKFGLSWLQTRHQGGSLVFTHNHLYGHENGSLIFFFTMFSDNLVIRDNTLHTNSCDCSIVWLLGNMTEDSKTLRKNFKEENEKTFKLFKDTSFCIDSKGKQSSLSSLCVENKGGMHWKLPLFMVVSVIITGLLVIVLKKVFCSGKFRRMILSQDKEGEYIIGEWDDEMNY